MLEPMYPAAVNSRQTELAAAIDDTQTSFTVLDGSVLPPAPNLLTLGTDESAETVLYTGKTGNEVTGITRGFESGAVSWVAGTKIARFFTAYDHDTFRENIADLDQRLSDIVIPPASLTEQGIVMLSKSTTGNRDNVAATESAVAAAFQAGVERKVEVVAALNSIGVSASTSETWDQLIPKIAAVIRATGNATAVQVLAGATFSNASTNGLTGSMVNRGAVSQNITAQNGSYTIPAGYHNGSGVIKAVFANLIAANIRGGVNVGGVIGTLLEGAKYATGKVTSSDLNGRVLFTKSTMEQIVLPSVVVSGLGFKPSIIILGVTGTNSDFVNSNGMYSKSTRHSAYPTYNWYWGPGSQTTPELWRVIQDSSLTTDAYVNNDGFRLPFIYTTTQLVWEAYGY